MRPYPNNPAEACDLQSQFLSRLRLGQLLGGLFESLRGVSFFFKNRARIAVEHGLTDRTDMTRALWLELKIALLKYRVSLGRLGSDAEMTEQRFYFRNQNQTTPIITPNYETF
jgi:hypothetical protein